MLDDKGILSTHTRWIPINALFASTKLHSFMMAFVECSREKSRRRRKFLSGIHLKLALPSSWVRAERLHNSHPKSLALDSDVWPIKQLLLIKPNKDN